MRIGVIGINHKAADLALREHLAKTLELRFAPGRFLYPFVLISTCNRTEIYFTAEILSIAHEMLLQAFRADLIEKYDAFEQKLYTFFGKDCFQHLCKVVTGLDSAVAGETEIQGQVRIAYEKYAEKVKLPSELHFLFQKALKIGKMIRTRHELAKGLPGIEHAIYLSGEHLFKNLETKKVLFVGASEINFKILKFFAGKKLQNLFLCNRTDHKAFAAAEKYGIQAIKWTNPLEWEEYDWVIFGTHSKEFLARRSPNRKPSTSQKLLIDLSVPRNVEPSLAKDPHILLLNIDQINRMLKFRTRRIQESLKAAEDEVAIAARKQMVLFQQKQAKREIFALEHLI